ncbi:MULTISPECIES: thiamine pyrophosphate-dependent enzyme [Methanocalculus]|uniref:thiamine pyrophosphate-dependent enzyme n=1 Tax=Methanocalculus TaxID=71151 RepID=UPI00209ED469|nr:MULTISPECIES: thiamine pyrophosphate-dependent enzyme [unclassified Methanocalculus]MCP1661521.1 pyruvate oxidase [Methanocalculus sp. AMF5]
MSHWKCSVCGYVYDEEAGEPSTRTEPKTRFDELPEDWRCPVCAAGKTAFSQISADAPSGPALSMIWRCTVCNYRYSEDTGEPATNTPPGTRFAELAEDWRCPVCGAARTVFVMVRKDAITHEQSEKTVSDVIIGEMVSAGIDLVFGLPGTSSLGLVDAIRKNGKVRYIVVRHEEAAAMAASAYNKLTGRIAACLTIAGPGATNLATGLYDAKEDGASVLSLNGQVEMQYTGEYGMQEIDQDAFFRPVTVYNNTISDRKMTLLLLSRAIRYATLRHGVAQLSIPNDIQKQPLDPSISRREAIIPEPAVIPDATTLKEAADAIEAAENPVVLAGFGAYDDGAAVLRFAEAIDAPILTTYRAKGILPEDHPRVISVLGSVGSPQARLLAERSDLIICFGVGFSKFTNVPQDSRIIQVDTNPLRLGIGRQTIPLFGTCSETIPLLAEMVSKKTRPGLADELAGMKKAWSEQLENEADSTAVPIRPPYLMKVLSETLPADAVICLDVGENQWWFGRNFRMNQQRFTMSGYLGTMGFGFPAALAAKLAYPEKQVVCITGDGGFSQAMADFVTAVKYDLPMVVIIMNNRQLGMIQVEQLMENYPNFGTDLHNPDFAAYAGACGGAGIRVEQPDELAGAVQKALSMNVPVIVDVISDARRIV